MIEEVTDGATQRIRRPTRADAERKRQIAWQARVAGATWEEAATAAGYQHHSTAIRAVRRWRDELPQPDIDEARAVARQRGETLWRHALKDVLDRRPGAVTAAVRVLQRQASLLGTDAPTRIDTTHSERVEAVFAWLSEPAPTSPPPWQQLPRGGAS